MRFWAVWQRNFLVWRKLAIPSMLGNLADPLLYMLGFGYGLGQLLPQVDGVSYLQFLAAGSLCYSTMNSATFETLYSAFSRMHVQKSWDAILNAPMSLHDVMLGEWVWAASKSLLSGLTILAVILLMGLSHSWQVLWLIPLALLIGLCFSGIGLVVMSVAKNYDFFTYYFTLAISPMVLLGGVFYPASQLPEWLHGVSSVLPLTHAVDLARALINGTQASSPILSILVLFFYGIVGYFIAHRLCQRRLLK